MQTENKYDLKQMLEEIKQDEAIGPRRVKTVSQKEINEIVKRKRKGSHNDRQS